MVTDKPAYSELMEYLKSSQEMFQHADGVTEDSPILVEFVEREIIHQVITLCSQHNDLETNHRSIIVREIDSIVYDMQQILAPYWEQPVTPEQIAFIQEFTSLVKNVFDGAIADLLD
jgi:hypothetical protein